MYEVAQRTSARIDRGLQGFLDHRDQAGQAFQRYFARSGGRVDSGTKQAFRGVDVANADNAVTIHQGWFDSCLETGKRFFEPRWRKFIGQWFNAEYANQRMFGNVALQPQNGSEAARVVHSQGDGSAPATKRQIDVIMFLGVQTRVDQAQAARWQRAACNA